MNMKSETTSHLPSKAKKKTTKRVKTCPETMITNKNRPVGLAISGPRRSIVRKQSPKPQAFVTLKFKALTRSRFHLAIMTGMTKDILRQKIQELGEEPPQSWSKTQLEARYVELKDQVAPSQNLAKFLMIELNKAKKKRSQSFRSTSENSSR